MSVMTPDPESYFRRFIPQRDALLKELEEAAGKEDIPIIGPVVGELLHILVAVAKPMRILELGAAVGYSAIWMGRAAAAYGGVVVTCETDAEMAERARGNIARAGLEKTVRVLEKDALKALERGGEPFSFAFLDIEKIDYARALSLIERSMTPGGLLVADNTAFADSGAFNRAIQESPRWRCVNLHAFLPGHSPEHDGVCIALLV